MHIIVSVMTSVFLACSAAPEAAPDAQAVSATVEQAEAARQALVEWFECEECEEGQMQAVVKYGQTVVPSLRSALISGASPASRELLRRELATRYDELRKYQETHPYAKVASSKEQFIASNLDNLNAQYQVRAAEALSAIGGAAAARALEEGAGKAKRSDVRESIKKSLARMKR